MTLKGKLLSFFQGRPRDFDLKLALDEAYAEWYRNEGQYRDAEMEAMIIDLATSAAAARYARDEDEWWQKIDEVMTTTTKA